MRKMYDSTSPNDIPTNAPMVAGYIDGIDFRWPESSWSRFPNSVKVRIARRTSTNDGHVLDVEKGIPTVWPLTDPAVRRGILSWVQMRRNSGMTPTIYCNQLNDWDPLRKIFRDAQVPEPLWWVARYDNKVNIPPGAIAKQYANPPIHDLGHFDLSAVADYWPGVDGPHTTDGVNDMTPDQAAQLTRIENALWLTAQAPVAPDGAHETLFDAVWKNRKMIEEGGDVSGVIDYDLLAAKIADNLNETLGVTQAEIAEAVRDALNNTKFTSTNEGT